MKRIMLLLWLHAGCAAATATSGSPPLFLRAWQPPPEQSCHASTRPERLPAFRELADSARIHAAVSSQAARAAAPDSVLFAIRVDSTGAVGTPLRLESTLPAGDAEQLAETLREHLRPQSPGDAHRVLLRVDLAPEPRFLVGRSEECPPALVNRQEFTRQLRREFAALVRRHDLSAVPRRVLVEVRIDSTGQVVQTRPAQLSGVRAVDSLAMNLAQQARFHPARLDRQPVAVWVRFPLDLQIEERRPPASAPPERAGPPQRP